MELYKINMSLIALYFHLTTQQLHSSDFPKLNINDLCFAILCIHKDELDNLKNQRPCLGTPRIFLLIYWQALSSAEFNCNMESKVHCNTNLKQDSWRVP